jgi:short-subunit dehydrogenase
MKRIAIFGATSAIATACARLWATRGGHLFLVARNQEKLDCLCADLKVRAGTEQAVTGASADLSDLSCHADLLMQAEAALGGLDVVLVAHGTLPEQKSCAASVELTLEQMRTNGLSVISLATLVGNRFAAQQSGVLAVIGSVAGDRGRASNYVYGAAKGMVALFLQGLRNRLFRCGVTVLTIKPGFVDTPMTAHIAKSGPLWAQPEQIAGGIVNAIEQRKDVVYLPWFWRWIMLIIRLIPERIFKRMPL